MHDNNKPGKTGKTKTLIKIKHCCAVYMVKLCFVHLTLPVHGGSRAALVCFVMALSNEATTAVLPSETYYFQWRNIVQPG